MEPRLKSELADMEQMLRRAQMYRQMAICWLAACALGMLFFLLGWHGLAAWGIPLAVALIAVAIVSGKSRPSKSQNVVAALEREHPELRHMLSAAAEQEPDPESGEFRYLQLRVIEAVLNHPGRIAWREKLEKKFSTAGAINLAAIISTLILLLVLSRSHSRPVFKPWIAAHDITVTPGDTQIERGSSLVISARFGGQPPAEAALIMTTASGKTRRIPMERHLADPVFGASLSEVSEEGHYRVEYEGKKTGDFKVSVFDFPALVRADAQLRYPKYTGMTNETIPDTRRVTAIEGTVLNYTFQLNKPVATAALVSTNQSLNLNLNLTLRDGAVALLPDYIMTNGARYTLALKDADGRSSKFPADIVIRILTNRPPELKLIFPQGDQRVTRLEELQLKAEARGEFGLLKYGIGYGLAGADPHFVELGQSSGREEKKQFNYLIPLETLPLEEDQVLDYFVWADDYGPDGNVRRTFGDMFFAEVRPFEETYRADQSGQGQGQGQGNGGVKLAEMQKEIVIATWKLRQEKPSTSTKRSP
jgi:hypothetical protein